MTTEAPHQRTRPEWRSALLALAAYAVFDLALPLIRIHPGRLTLAAAALLVIVPTAIFMLLQVWLSRALVGLRPGARTCLLLMAAAVALWLLTLTQFPRLFPLAGIHLHLRPTKPQVLLLSCRSLLLGLFITLACTYLGILLSRIVREANILLPVALIAMPIDYLGAMTSIGFTKQMVTHNPGIVQAVSVPVPSIGGLRPISFIGPGDALFMAFFFAVVLRLNMNDRGTFWGMFGLLTAAMLLVISPYGVNVAALVPMGLAVLLANFRFFRLQRSEVFAAIYASGLVLALVVAFYLYSHSHFFHHH